MIKKLHLNNNQNDWENKPIYLISNILLNLIDL